MTVRAMPIASPQTTAPRGRMPVAHVLSRSLSSGLTSTMMMIITTTWDRGAAGVR